MKFRIKFDEWYIEANDDSTIEEITRIVLDTLIYKGIKNNLTLTIEVVKDENTKDNKKCVS